MDDEEERISNTDYLSENKFDDEGSFQSSNPLESYTLPNAKENIRYSFYDNTTKSIPQNVTFDFEVRKWLS